MGLVDALAAPPATGTKIADLLDSLSDEDASALRSALADLRWTHAHLARVLTDNGHPVSESSIRRWRERNG